jgi:hypothetical protein
MTSRDYANKVRSSAGAIRALIDMDQPCAQNCAAHPIHTKVMGHLADCQEANADFWGNGGIDEIAARVVAGMTKPPPATAKVESKLPAPVLWAVELLRLSPYARMVFYTAVVLIATSTVPSCTTREVKQAAEQAMKAAVKAEASAGMAKDKAEKINASVVEIVGLLKDEQP